MKLSPNVPKPNVLLLPLVGMGLFILLYLLAALNYPGGSWIILEQKGFSFWNNYLCDLLDHYAINGELNPARHFARASLGMLCASLILLWYYLPGLFSVKSSNLTIMWVTGIISLVITLFLASGTHDITVRIAGIFAVIAFITCFVELYKARYFKLVMFGVACLLIFLANYYIYETGEFLHTLPTIQKITFVSYIIWFVFLDLVLYRKLKMDFAKKIGAVLK
jgi:hypothetical protein